ncbi:MAG: Hsp20/alpha crystallin family protein [Clostridiales bacterium]|jgi:HSP20 family protein|nr:Hsp20/alpha crystallin family protein [Clostridiales bacterium]
MANLIPFNRRVPDIMSNGFFDFRNMLDDFFSDDWPVSLRRRLSCDTFKVDVQENEKEYLIEAELPGVTKDEVNIRLTDGRLNISVHKEENVEENKKNYIHKERRCSSMSRSIFLNDADAQNVKAKLDNGILSVTVPKITKKDSAIDITIE